MQLTKEATIPAKAIAFDMDGTLIDSKAVIENIWRDWASLHNVNFDALLRVAHGRKAIETIRMWAPAGVDPDIELHQLMERAAISVDGLKEIKGAALLLRSLPPHSWGIVTSAERHIALKWLQHLHLPIPEILVSASDVPKGKPDPSGYFLAAEKLGCRPDELVIFEDAENGLAAGDNAGGIVVALATQLSPDEIKTRPWIIDYSAVTYANGALLFS